jgi:hypothetical protein
MVLIWSWIDQLRHLIITSYSSYPRYPRNNVLIPVNAPEDIYCLSRSLDTMAQCSSPSSQSGKSSSCLILNDLDVVVCLYILCFRLRPKFDDRLVDTAFRFLGLKISVWKTSFKSAFTCLSSDSSCRSANISWKSTSFFGLIGLKHLDFDLASSVCLFDVAAWCI